MAEESLQAGKIGETYEEYTVSGVRVALIADPENGDAWIQSDVTKPIQP